MISFATEVKNELARQTLDSVCCRQAELAALLKSGATLTLGGEGAGLAFFTENAAVARRVLIALKDFGVVTTELTVRRANRLKKSTQYEVRALPQPAVTELIEKLKLGPVSLPTLGRGLLKRSCCEVSYLRGAFMSAGSVNRPGADYHLEFVAAGYQFGEFLYNLAGKLGFPVGFTDRKELYVVYMKEADAIAEFLGLAGAADAVEQFEISRNLKEVRNQVNRLINCETANLQKTVDAAGRQIAAIRKIMAGGGAEKLPEILREAATARLEHPDASLAELGAILHLGKSGVNHRLRSLLELAEEME